MKDPKMFALSVFTVLFFYMHSCGSSTEAEPAVPPTTTFINTTGSLDYNSVHIVRVKDCDYVFWENHNGSQMEHYEGCTNPAHSK